MSRSERSLLTFCSVLIAALIGWLFWTEFQLPLSQVRLENMELREKHQALHEQNKKLGNELLKERGLWKCDTIVCEDGRCYGVQRGDTFYDLAQRFYGNHKLHKKLMEMNRIIDPAKLMAESCICIPNLGNTTKLSSKPKSRRSLSERSPKASTTFVIEPKKLPKHESADLTPPVEENKKEEKQPDPPAKTENQQAPKIQLPLTADFLKETPPFQKVSQDTIPPLLEAKPYVSLPGNAWNSSGNLSPVEKGNILSYSHLEQGMTALKLSPKTTLVPYVSLDIVRDSLNYDWNNKVVSQVGVKLARTFNHGIAQIGGAYAEEYRWESGLRTGQPIGYASYWFGWNQPTHNKPAKRFFHSFPGSTWGIVGNISPAENNNIIGAAYAQQGITAVKIGGLSFVPFGEYVFNKDTKEYEWNNRQMYGGGAKVIAPFRHGVLEIGSSYQRETRFESGLEASGFRVFGNFWFGWNPRIGNR